MMKRNEAIEAREAKLVEMSEIRQNGPFVSNDPEQHVEYCTFQPEVKSRYYKLDREVHELDRQIEQFPENPVPCYEKLCQPID